MASQPVPTRPQRGDGAAAILVGDDSDGPVVARCLGRASRTLEITERWRALGETRSRSWDERFGASVYGPFVADAWAEAVDGAAHDGIVDHLVVTGLNARAVSNAVGMLDASARRVVDALNSTVGNTATAHGALLLCSALEQARPEETIAVVSLADGVDVIVLRATDALSRHRTAASVDAQIASGGPVSYGRFLAWRGAVEVEPPNRPLPSRPSSPAAYRRADWKYAFTGSQDRSSRMVHLPPARVSEKGGALDDAEPVAMSHRVGTVVSFTIDRLGYSPSPPTVFAVVDFDGGGRAALELADVDASDVRCRNASGAHVPSHIHR